MMNRALLFFILFFTASNVYAGYAASLGINRIRTHEAGTYVGTSYQPSNTCSQWGEYFKFDHRTESGRAYLYC